MRFLGKAMIFLFFSVFAANASAHDNTRISVYLHPVALLVGLNDGMPMVYSTVEVPFSLYNALIVKPSLLTLKPSLWTSVKDKNEVLDSNVELLSLGSDIGFRHYPAGTGEGLYLQGQAGLFYLSVKDISDKKEFRVPWYDFMGYFGYAYKFAYMSIYSDTGLGYACVGGSKSNFKYSGKCTLAWDANFGIGIPF